MAACDPKQMVTFLQQHPDKAAAWSAVLGIRPDAIPDYVGGLTPVILRSDTYVTNHGFNAGRPTTIPAVLQAGTAVLVDSKGVPVTKCYCGNPLTAPVEHRRRQYVGATWSGFSASRITVIRAARTEIKIFTLVDPTTNQMFDRPSGTTGGRDQDSNAQRAPGGTDPVNLDGSWRSDDNAVGMTVNQSGDQTNFHWTLFNDSRGWRAGPRAEVCVVLADSVRIGRVQLTCHTAEFPDDKWNIYLDVIDRNHVSIPRDSHFFGPLSGSFGRT
jgi:hypothetical protein